LKVVGHCRYPRLPHHQRIGN